jgi:hypothetical protein
MLKFLIIYYSNLKMGKFINWDILSPIILDPCLLIPLYLINFNIQYSKLNLNIMLIQDLMIKAEIKLKFFL